MPVPVVGVGASAGGLEAFTQLLAHLPPDCGMAFVLIQHLDPTHPSLLAETLARATAMPVRQAEDGMPVEPNHVYVIPPGADLALRAGRLDVVSRRDAAFRPRLAIDLFMRSLAADRGRGAIGVILSGSASDGTAGLAAIKAARGITLAQDPQAAKFGAMPQSAIDAGVVDLVLPIDALAGELVRLSRHPHVTANDEPPEPVRRATLAAILAAVRDAVGVDFSRHDQPSIARRLARRMAVRGIDDLHAYGALLQADGGEVRHLHAEMLAHVRSFFRDPAAFASLATVALPAIIAHKPNGGTIRLWVAGCASGEEVYSLAIALLELLRGSGARHTLELIGSDVNEEALATARAGVYPESVLATVAAERRRRYFRKTAQGYRINKTVRDLCVFVRHDLVEDPPLAGIDLLSCRDILVCLGPLLKRLLPAFHDCLNQPGFLLLGRAQGIPRVSTMFSMVDDTGGLFARIEGRGRVRPAWRTELPGGDTIDAARQLDRMLVARYAPAGVLIDERMDVLSFGGETGAFLRPAPGRPQHNLLELARPGLVAALRSAIVEARAGTAPVTRAASVANDGVTTSCEVIVIPCADVPQRAERLYVVIFEQATPRNGRTPGRMRRPTSMLAAELEATKDQLQSVNEQHARATDDLEWANDELSSGNEELQSVNEELHGTNEELETAKEELQSTNEALTTVNDELRSRNVELNQVNGDLLNLIATVDFPILFLDRERRIRRFTPKAQTIFAVLPTDVGRRIDELKLNIEAPDLDRQIETVIETMTMLEEEVQDRLGRWHRLQIRPYKTIDDRIDGAMLSLVDIDALRQHVSEADKARADAERANRAKDQFLALLSHELRTPLSTMLMQAQLLQRGGMEGPRLKRAGQALERATRLQARLIDDLLDISRIVTGKLRIEREVVGLAQVVRAAIDSVAAPATARSIRLQIHVDDAVGELTGDPARLQQVVVNLLGNAIKFTSQGGEVTLTLAREDGQARLTVTDSGQGIDAAFLPYIWNRFSQEDSSSTRSFGGLGLGLAIVRHLVEAHGGTVTAASQGTGRGATFSIMLPLLPRSAGAVPSLADLVSSPAVELASGWVVPRGEPGEELRVLLIDDDAGTRDAIAELLRRLGAKVRVTSSATEALTALAAERPSVVLCDIVMPGQDGYGFIEQLRRLGPERGGDVPVLALTALAGEEDRQRALAAGFQMHLTKPVDIEHLTEAVMTLVGPRSFGAA